MIFCFIKQTFKSIQIKDWRKQYNLERPKERLKCICCEAKVLNISIKVMRGVYVSFINILKPE
jgi:hypothetical protein